MTAKELAPFIKSSVKELFESDDASTFKRALDADFTVYVGRGCGFDKDDNTCLHSKSEPTYCICVKVAQNGPYLWDDAYMPWNKYGEVYDTDCSVGQYTDYYQLAKWLLSSYRSMRSLLKKGEITFSD